METDIIEALENRAECMLPPAVMMYIECAGDATGDLTLLALLEEAEEKGLRGEPLCEEPHETVIFDDRVLLRCRGCARAALLPRFAGIGRGRDRDEARRNALYALTLPPDRTIHRKGCLGAMRYGKGRCEEVRYACAFNRAAYLHGVP